MMHALKLGFLLLLVATSMLFWAGCEKSPSNPDPAPADTAWGWDEGIVSYDPGQPIQVRAGAQYDGDSFVLCGLLNDTLETGFVMRVSMAGDSLWFVESAYRADDIDVAADGRIWMSGLTRDESAWFARVNEDGSVFNLTILANLEPRVVRGTPDGGCVFAAHKDEAIELFKFSSTGIEQWQRTFEGAWPYDVSDVAVVEDGYLIAGRGEAEGVETEWMMLRVDADGFELWRAGSASVKVSEVEVAPGDLFASVGTMDNQGRHGFLQMVRDTGVFSDSRDLGANFIPGFLLVLEDGTVLTAGQNELNLAIRAVICTIAPDMALTKWEYTLQHGINPAAYQDVYVTCAGVNTSRQIVAVGTADIDDDGESEIYFNTINN